MFWPQIRKFDWLLLGSCALLASLGLIMLFGTSWTGGGDTATADFGNFWKQVAFAAAGLILAIALSAFNYRLLVPLAPTIYALGALLLASVLIFGTTIRGTTGWFRFGVFNFQPVEAAKILLVIVLARFFANRTRDTFDGRKIIGSALLLLPFFVLVAIQPDFGSAFLMLAVWGGLLLVCGIRWQQILMMVLVFSVSAVFAWLFVLQPYQKERVLTFLNPDKQTQDWSYNGKQSVIAVGSGGWWGKGLGFGSQSQLRFLPERQTDFIFAVVAEELGLIGVILLCGLFGAFFYRAWLRARLAKDDFTLFLASGLIIYVAVEVFVHIGGALRLLPVTGVTLPFVSYGGSSLLMKFAAVGILESIAVREATA